MLKLKPNIKKIVLASVVSVAVAAIMIKGFGNSDNDEDYVQIFHEKLDRLSEMDDSVDDEQPVYDKDFLTVYRNLPELHPDYESPSPLLGWDTNKNGIRDDVERTLILRYYPKSEMQLLQMAALQFVRDAQVSIEDYISEKHHLIVSDIHRLAEDRKCITDVLNYLNSIDSHGIEAMDEINYITSVIFNTQERINIYSVLVQQEELDLKGKIDRQNVNFCDFNIGDTESSRDMRNIRMAATPSEYQDNHADDIFNDDAAMQQSHSKIMEATVVYASDD